MYQFGEIDRLLKFTVTALQVKMLSTENPSQ